MSAPAPTTGSEKSFRVLLALSTAFGFGALLGTLPLAQRGAAGLEWHFHWASVPLFLIGVTAGLLFWRSVFRLETDSDDNHAKRRLKRAAFAVIPLGIIGFFYPLRFVTPERRTEVFIGLGIALTVLSFLGFVIANLIRWLNENEPPDGQP